MYLKLCFITELICIIVTPELHDDFGKKQFSTFNVSQFLIQYIAPIEKAAAYFPPILPTAFNSSTSSALFSAYLPKQYEKQSLKTNIRNPSLIKIS